MASAAGTSVRCVRVPELVEFATITWLHLRIFAQTATPVSEQTHKSTEIPSNRRGLTETLQFHSIGLGGFEDTSQATRFTPGTSLTILRESTSYGTCLSPDVQNDSQIQKTRPG